jgi:hypothetical protein
MSIRRDEPTTGQLILTPLAEFLFVLLPLLVLAIVDLSNGKSYDEVLASPEWSFGAAILFGQTIFKLVAGTLRAKAGGWEPIALTVALLIVLGLVPSLIVLAEVLTKSPAGRGLVIFQISMFLFGAIFFLVLGCISHYGLFHAGLPRFSVKEPAEVPEVERELPS